MKVSVEARQMTKKWPAGREIHGQLISNEDGLLRGEGSIRLNRSQPAARTTAWKLIIGLHVTLIRLPGRSRWCENTGYEI